MSDFNKPYNKMDDDEKLAYSRHIQSKYIKDLDEYLKVLNNGKISLHKRQIIEWVEGLRTYNDNTLDAGWKDFIQTFRPNFLPSIADAREHFKKYNVTIHKAEEPAPDAGDNMSNGDFHKFLSLCMRYKHDGPIVFNENLIKFWKEMADQATDPTVRSDCLASVREQERELRKEKKMTRNNSALRGNRSPL